MSITPHRLTLRPDDVVEVEAVSFTLLPDRFYLHHRSRYTVVVRGEGDRAEFLVFDITEMTLTESGNTVFEGTIVAQFPVAGLP